MSRASHESACAGRTALALAAALGGCLIGQLAAVRPASAQAAAEQAAIEQAGNARAFSAQAFDAHAFNAHAAAGPAPAPGPAAARPADCRGTVYLTLDTGNMAEAERIAQILVRHRVRATFFLANEKTPRGDHALDDGWAGYWRARVAEGHAFGSHTFDHVYFRADPARGPAAFTARPQFGASAGRTLAWNGEAVCSELKRVDARLRELAGRGLDPLWRAPGGKAPQAVMRAADDCGYRHVHWAPAGFLGDELPSESFPNARLLERALRDIRDGDVLMAHLGIWSRRDPYAPTLDPLIAGLKARGLCFATIPEHPGYRPRPPQAAGRSDAR